MSCSKIVDSMSVKLGATRPVYEFVCGVPSSEGDGSSKSFRMRTINPSGVTRYYPLMFVGVIQSIPGRPGQIGWRVQFQYAESPEGGFLQENSGDYLCDIEVKDNVDTEYVEYFPKAGKFKFTVC